MESARKVVTEAEILAVPCKTCGAPIGKLCRANGRVIIPFTTSIEQTEASFHQVRIIAAQTVQMLHKFDQRLTPAQKFLATYYAFVMLSDSASTKSVEMLGKHFTTEALQAFFIHNALEELKKDGLL